MEKTTKIKESSLLYRKIDELALTRNEHSKAIGALKAADRLTDTLYWVYWVIGKLRQRSGPLNPKFKLKHE